MPTVHSYLASSGVLSSNSGFMNFRSLSTVPATSAGGTRQHPPRSLGPSKVGRAAEEFLPHPCVRLLPVPTAPALTSQLSNDVRPKKVTDPLAEAVRDCLYGNPFVIKKKVRDYRSNGSDNGPDSVSLAAMVDEFLENETSIDKSGCIQCTRLTKKNSAEASGSSDSDDSSCTSRLAGYLQDLVSTLSNKEATILEDVRAAFDTVCKAANFTFIGQGAKHSDDCIKRAVMKRLRETGYNAGICKSRWGHSLGSHAGDFEYIDILGREKSDRVMVDLDFRSQFEIARPTHHYLAILQILPPIFVGKPDKLKQIVNSMSDAVQHSLSQQGLHFPPWRKPEYIKAKWFSPYKRTTNDSAHSRSDNDIVTVGFSGIGTRVSGLDAKCTNELEMLYHEANERLQMGRDGLKKRQTANKVEFEQTRRKKSADECGIATVGIRAASTGWEPPPLDPKPQKKAMKVAGLASVLRQARLRLEELR